MIKYLLVFLLFSNKVFCQSISSASIHTSFKHPVKRLTEDSKYISQKARMSIIDYLNSKHLDANKYFIDSSTSVNGDTLIINIWDIVGIVTVDKVEKLRDSLRTAGSKLKIPYLIGNPGNCFTAYFDNKSEKLIAIDIWQ